MARKSKFYLRSLQVFDQEEDKKPSGEMLLQFGLINVTHAVDLSIDTSLGRMSLAKNSIHNTDLLLKLANLSTISSFLEYTIKTDGSKTLSSLLEDVEKSVSEFLMISSLSQTIWQEWVYFRIFEKDPYKQDWKFLYSEIHSRLPKIPFP
ncbi:MAG: hypothetical protein WAM14_09850 [Candidatus Nitrosopolaris sp.]